MRLSRAVLTALVIAALVGMPALVSPAGSLWGHGLVRAAPASGVLADNDNGNGNANQNDNGNANDNGDNSENDNDDNGNTNGNSNDNDDNGNTNSNSNDNDDEDNGNDNRYQHHGPPPPPAPPPPPPGVVSQCYGAGETGSLTLTLPGGSVALTIVPGSRFGQDTHLTLAKIDPASVAGAPGARLDEIVFELRAQAGCDGSGLGELPADANLGLAYTGPTTPGLTFAVWDGSRWSPVPTVADPNPANPYISATIRRTGTYTVYRAP
ncbi:MAG: hypothetical protein IT306_19720 [Chloroflexi bacterium]|nr:hypothetical protein [Chloroflexota bacterium]